MNKTSSILLLLLSLSLTACQTTSLREVSNSQVSATAPQQQGPDYPAPEENQLRMYIFTGFDDPENQNKPRQGYFIDFENIKAPTNALAKPLTNAITKPLTNTLTSTFTKVSN